jgi:hypothetical protein
MTRQTCSRSGAVEVIGRTGNHYTVRFTPLGPICSCAGFHYRDKCRHLDEARAARCTWRTGDEPEMIPGACPRCGAATTAATPITVQPRRGGLVITVTVAAGDGGSVATAGSGHSPVAYRVRRSTDNPIVCPACLPFAAPTAIDIAPLTLLDLPAHDARACDSCFNRLVPAEHALVARLLHSIV